MSLSRSVFRIGLLALLTIAFIAWFSRLRHGAQLELSRVEAFRRALCDEADVVAGISRPDYM